MASLVLTCGYTALFLYLIARLRFFDAQGLRRRTLGALFLLKIAAGTALWAVYTYYYPDRSTADIYKYFDDGNVMFSALAHRPLDYLRMLFAIGNDTPWFDEHYYSAMNNWYRRYDTGYYNDSHTMIRFSAAVRLFSFGVYHVHTVFASFLSLVGLVAFYKAFIGFVPGLGRWLMAGIFLWPSMVFWSSAPIKEAVVLFGLGLFVLHFFRLMRGPLPWHGWLWLAVGLWIQLILKSYLLACMAPGLAALWWCRRTGNRRAVMKFAIAHATAILLVAVLPRVHPSLDAVAIIQQKQGDLLGLVAEVETGSFIPTTRMEPGWGGLIREVPHALYLSFISPLTIWRNGAFNLLSAAEMLLFLLLTAWVLLRYRRWQGIDLPLMLYCIAFILALALLIGWTTPVVGALMRYRIPMLPFHTLALLLVVSNNRPTAMPSDGNT